MARRDEPSVEFAPGEFSTFTDLPNRQWLDNTMPEKLEKNPGSTAVFYFDLDDLKFINDTRGHAEGDETIKAAARAIEGAVRGEERDGEDVDTVAYSEQLYEAAHSVHLSGDEIIVTMYGIKDLSQQDAAQHLKAVGERIRSAIYEGGEGRKIRASFGVVLHEPGEQMKELVDRASIDMIEDKKRRKEIKGLRKRAAYWLGSKVLKSAFDVSDDRLRGVISSSSDNL